MPIFSHDVPVDPRGPAFPIVRTPPGRAFLGVITSENLVGCYTHYFKGRTMPCESAQCHLCQIGDPVTQNAAGVDVHQSKGEETRCDGPACDACLAGMPYRWHAYQSAYVRETSLHCLFECTAQAAEVFTEYREAHGTIRGCEFEARRYNSRPNGRILIRTRPADLTKITLPKPPDLIKCLAILWGLPQSDVGTQNVNSEKKTAEVYHHARKDDPTPKTPAKRPKKPSVRTKETLSDVDPQTPVE